MLLQTQRLRIRHFRKDDLPSLFPICSDADVMKFISSPWSEEQTAAYIAEMIELSATNGLGRYAVELKDTSELIGFCGYRPEANDIDLGYRYAKHVWGQGIGLEAAIAVRDYGKNELQVENVVATAAIANRASVKILDSLQFTYRQEILYDDLPSIQFSDHVILQQPTKD